MCGDILILTPKLAKHTTESLSSNENRNCENEHRKPAQETKANGEYMTDFMILVEEGKQRNFQRH